MHGVSVIWRDLHIASPISSRRVRQNRTGRRWATAPFAALCSIALLSRRHSRHYRKAGQCILRQGQRVFRSPFENLRIPYFRIGSALAALAISCRIGTMQARLCEGVALPPLSKAVRTQVLRQSDLNSPRPVRGEGSGERAPSCLPRHPTVPVFSPAPHASSCQTTKQPRPPPCPRQSR